MKFRRGLAAIAVLAATTLLLAGCAQASQKYASDSKDGVYFAVPNSWNSISPKALNDQESLSTAQGASDLLAEVHWQIAYTPDKKIKASDVLSLTAPSEPVVYARVRSLSSDEIQEVSYNDLRDLIVPLTSWEDGTAASTPTYNVISDQEDVQKGSRGVHTVFSFVENGVSQTLDQTGLISNDHRTLIMFVARCTTVCYNKDKSEIDKVVASFTDRGTN